MPYTSSDLKYVKNVKHQKGDGWAYTRYGIGDIFALNFPRGHRNMGRANAGVPHAGEVIMIFQTVNRNATTQPGTYLTHLVTPIDEAVNEIDSPHPFTRNVVVVAKPTTPIPKPRAMNFFKPNRGWVCELNIVEPFTRENIQMTLESKQILFWNLFDLKDVDLKDIIEGQSKAKEYGEGKELFEMRRHRYYERNSFAVNDKKAAARDTNTMKCEVCEFDFAKRYGDLGKDFIECHHLVPIATGGERKTRLEDLSLVCSNCHRMLHKKDSRRQYPTMSELKQLYDDRRDEL